MKTLVFAVALLVHQVMSDRSIELISQASNEFSNRLYSELASEPGNLLVCPLSLHVALELVHQGAGGRTAQELTNVLRLDGANGNVKQGYKAILTGLQDNVLKIVTKLYPQIGYQLNDDYTNVARRYFLSEIENLNYSDPVVAANTINKYVEDHTNNKIHDLIKADSIDDLTRLIIVNAIHFNAQWKYNFDQTYDDSFTVSPTEKVPAKMMTQTNYFGYKEDPELKAKVLKMDYKEGDYSMIFILPDKEDGLPALEAKLSSTNLNTILNGLKDTKVEVTIPKFRIEKSLDLQEVLKKMGIKDMFNPTANLRNIANGENLYVSDVVQKTFINVHENGTEAAAATGTLIETLSASLDEIEFHAKRPFTFYLIKSRRPNVSLFRGRLMHPGTLVISEQDRMSQSQNMDNIEEIIKQNRRPQLKPNQVSSTDSFINSEHPGNSQHNSNSQQNQNINTQNGGGIFSPPQTFETASPDNYNYQPDRSTPYRTPYSSPRDQWRYRLRPRYE